MGDDAAVRRAQKQRRIGGRPLPNGLAVCAKQCDAVEVEEAGAVGRVKLERVGRRLRQREGQCLAYLTDGAGGSELARFVELPVEAQIQLGGEQRLRRQGTGGSFCGRCRCDSLFGRSGARDDDELVGQRVRQGQQMACHGRGQGVERDVELGIRQLPRDDIGLHIHPAVLAQKAHQRAPGEEAHVGLVQQAFLAVAELAGHQLGHQAGIAGVGDGQQQAAFGRQQLAAFGQHAGRLADVLQHVGADDGVVALGGEQVAQAGVVEVGHLDAAVMRGGQAGLVGADGEAVDDGGAGAVALGQVAPDGTAAAAQVEHPCAGRDVAGEHGKGGAFAAVDLAVVDVQRGGRIDHEIERNVGPEARRPAGLAGERMLPCGAFRTLSGHPFREPWADCLFLHE